MYVVTVSREEVMDYLGSAEHTLGITALDQYFVDSPDSQTSEAQGRKSATGKLHYLPHVRHFI